MKIAVIGIGCRYPGANSAQELFENVLAGRRGFREMPSERWSKDGYYHSDKRNPDTTYCKKAALVEGFEFNPAEFRIPRTTYLATDTAQWMALKVAQEALKDAGVNSEENESTGVIIGNTLTGEVSRASAMRYRWPYVKRVFSELLDNFRINSDEKKIILNSVEMRYKAPFPPVNEDNLAGGLSNTIAGRICNYFDFKGGGFSTDGACSSSLLAINQACIGLQNGNCDLALAGGVDISLDPFEVVGFAKMGALSDSDIRVYDQYSNGFLPGEGCGIVVLQRYEEAIAQGKSVYAVVNGIGISSDGKGAITAPSVSGQSLAVSRAYGMADYEFSEVELIEGHGTGTPIGDKVELTTFIQCKQQDNSHSAHRCGIGSIKSNIGHTKAAAGVAGFIKAVMSVYYGVMPPTQCITTANELFNHSKHLYPLLHGRKWNSKNKSRRAAVSSAGFGGINTHITLSSVEQSESNTLKEQSEYYFSLLSSSQSSEVFMVGADSLEDLREKLQLLVDAAGRLSMAEVADMAYYCAQYFNASRLRLAFVATAPEHIESKLHLVLEHLSTASHEHEVELIDSKRNIFLRFSIHQPRIAYLFPGQASQSINMGQRLNERCHTVRRVWSDSDEKLTKPLGSKLSDLVFHDTDSATMQQLEYWRSVINNTAITQPAVTVASLASANFLRELGVRPDLAIGHSLGEYAALYSAGVLNFEQTLTLVAARGKAMADLPTQLGAMLSIGAGVEKVREFIADISDKQNGELVISNINSRTQTIVSGEVAVIEAMQKLCRECELSATRLPVSAAFHSKLMVSASQKMKEELKKYRFGRLRHMIISPSTGDFISDQCNWVNLLSEQILKPVNFIGAIETAVSEDCEVFVEVGPGSVLTALSKSILAQRDVLICASDIGDRGQHADGLNQLVAYLFACGVPLNQQKLFEGRFFRSFTLPYAPKFIDSPCEKKLSPLDLGLKKGVVIGEKVELGLDSQHYHVEDETLQTNNFQADGADDILQMLRVQITKVFGYSEEILTDNALLQDDLGLDSLKSVELAHEVMGMVGVQADVSHMQNASLQDLSNYIHQLKLGETSEFSSDKQVKLDLVMPDWVQAFEISAVTTAATEIDKNILIPNHILLVYEQENETLKAFQKQFNERNIKVDMVSVNAEQWPQGNFDAGIYLVNKTQPLKDWLDVDEHALQAKFVRPRALLKLAKKLIKSDAETQKYFTLVAMNGAHFWYSKGLQNQSLAEVGGGFVKTLHLEHKDILTRVIDMNFKLPFVTQFELILGELTNKVGHIDLAYNEQGIRLEGQFKLTSPARLSPTPQPLLSGDVVLITGGGKGITAECALSFAKKTGVKLALVGSSELTPNTEINNELRQNLKRFAEAGISCEYFACDVLDLKKLKVQVRQVERKMGALAAIIHAAGVNGLQKIEHAEWSAFERVLKPKMQGLINLLAATNVRKLKSLMVFSSVIANSGMAGNAEYAYANEWMNQLVRRVQVEYPDLACRAFGFSVWSEVGMGARLNSVELLHNMGIGAIPVSSGCNIFTQLIEKNWPDSQLLISSRMGELDTLRFVSGELAKNRFVENILHRQAGVELLSEIFLNPQIDLYLADHIYDGSMLFPAVMGIEAMVQCACACRVSEQGGDVQLPELVDLQFSKAIIVPPEGRAIRIYVQLDAPLENNEQHAHVIIRSSVTDYSQDYFKATCVWKDSAAKTKQIIPNGNAYLKLHPAKDLYGKILFQGKMFQNIRGYRALSSVHCIVDIDLPHENQLFNQQSVETTVMLGSGQVRDTFLHAVQLCVPEHRILPVSIERIVYFGSYDGKTGKNKKLILHALERERIKNEFLYDLEIYDSSGCCVEFITGFRCRIMGAYNDRENLAVILSAHQEYTKNEMEISAVHAEMA